MHQSYILGAAALLLAACTGKLENTREGVRIGLRAGVDEVEVSTRAVASPYEGTTPSSSNVLDASVWISTTSGAFANSGTPGNLATFPLHTEIQFNSSGLVYPVSDVLQYPESKTVYCVGLYPYSASAWTNTDASSAPSNSHASHVINGVDDLMFAPQVSGTKASPISTPLAFTHQLTWLKINVVAESIDAVTAWGNLTDITITSPYDTYTVNLSDGSSSCHGSTTDIIAFRGSQALTIASQSRGSVFCAPANSYNISVTTANLGTKAVGFVGLKGTDGTTPIADAASAKGRVFVITLSFRNVNRIDASCTLTAWEDTYQTIEGS